MVKHKDKHRQSNPPQRYETLNNIFLKNRIYLFILLGLLFLFFIEIIFKRGFLWEDFLKQNFPYRLFAARALHDGVFPFWNPYIFGGLPFYADIQTGTLFPTNLLLTIFVTGRWLSSYLVEIVMILHLLIAGIGMFYFGLHNKVSKPTSFFMGMVYMLNGSFIVHLTHTQQLQTFVLIPFIFLFLQKGLSGCGIRAVSSIIVCALLLGLAGLAGYPQAVVIIFTGVILFFIYHLISTPKRFGYIFLQGVILIVIFGLVVACQYLPTYLLFKASLRGAYGYQEIIEGSFHPLRFITFLIPNYFGTTAQGNYENYFGPGPAYQYWEQMAFFGIIPLILVIFSFYKRTRKEVVLPIILVGVSLLIGLGRHLPIHILLYKFVPFFKDIRTPAKFLNLAIFGLVWMSGIGLENIIILKPKAKRLLLCGVAISIICLILMLLLPKQISSNIRNIVVKDILRAIIIIILAILSIRKYLRNNFKKKSFLVIIIVLAFLDIFTFGHKFNSGKVDPEIYWGVNQIVDFFKSENKKELIRVNIRCEEGQILQRNIGYVQEFPTTDGYNPLALQRFQKASQSLGRDRFFSLMNVKYKTVFDSALGRLTIQPREFYLPRAKLFYDWDITPNPDSLLSKLNRADFPVDTKVILEQDIKIERPIDLTVANGTATITSYSLNKIKVEVKTQSPALLVLSENYFDNWLVKINGVTNKTIPVNYFLRGCIVPSGRSQVEFYYREKYFRLLFPISLLAILGSIIFIILCNLFQFYKSNRQRTEGYGRSKTTTSK